MKKNKKYKIKFTDIVKYSDVPNALLSKNAYKVRKKTHKEVAREFGKDKWGKLKKLVRINDHVHVEDLEKLIHEDSKKHPFFYKGKFFLANNRLIEELHLNIYSNILNKYLNKSTSLVELGAGFGSKILSLSKKKNIKAKNYVAAELTKTGRDLIKLSGKFLKDKLKVGFCDFRSMQIDSSLVSPNSIVFTSYSLHYVPEYDHKIIDYFIRLKPKAVIHFEPLYEEYCNNNTLYDLLCKRYMEKNDYTRNYFKLLKEAEKKKKCKIIDYKEKIISFSPFLPISVIIWKPLKQN